MSLEEKISWMVYAQPAIPRLGIPAFNFWNEALHGAARNGRATVFPQAIGMAATWDPDLIQRIASAIGDEARAKYHAQTRDGGGTGIYQGLTFWSPNVNIFRDPRWGRGQETWGEDPYLTGEMGAAYVRGLQGEHPKYLKAAACAKHYAVHSGPEKIRHKFDARVSARDLHGTYLPAFKKLVVEAHVEAVMGAYNRVNGEPCCASPLLLEEILRGEWGFQGHVVSDCGALSDFHTGHQVTRDAVESAVMALRAGCDLSCGGVYDQLGEAVERGLVSEADIDRSLVRTLVTRFKLGMFDPADQVPYSSIPMEVVGCPAHQDLAYQAALESVVLLKNKDRILPVGGSVRKILVVGPTAANLDVLLGSYYGLSDRMSTLLEGIAGAAPRGVVVNYRPGCLLTQASSNPLDWSYGEAASSDLTIACMGLSPLLEGEEGEALLSSEWGDRADISLPDVQAEFIRRIAMAGAKVVLVLTGGSPIALGDLADLVLAVVQVWYPGQEGGRAVADILFGKASPSGRLPVTIPQSVDQLPPFEDYDMAGRTYRFSTAEPLYPFGFGLSYTHFAYSDLRLERESLHLGENLSIRLVLANTGEAASGEVVQIYLAGPEEHGRTLAGPEEKEQGAAGSPVHSLVGFQRVHLDPGERRTLRFTLTPQMMARVDDRGEPVVAAGRYRLSVGGCSPGPRGQVLGAAALLSAEFEISDSEGGGADT